MLTKAIGKGTVVSGEYVLLESSTAGMSVFRAQHVASGRTFALRLWEGKTPDDIRFARDQLETAIRIRHPSLAAVEAFGRQQDGTWFIVSEYVQGQRLDAWADRVGIPPIDTAVDLMHRVCVGLNAALRNALVHDALHPGNLIVLERADATGRQQVKLLDLGVPAFMRPRPPRLQAALFMAPEQLTRALCADDRPALAASARMNVYSCGCLLYYLCTGGVPFQARSLEDLSLAHGVGKLGSPSRINPQIPRALEAVIVKALAFEPHARQASVAELAAALVKLRRLPSGSGMRLRAPAMRSAAEPKPDARTTWDAGAGAAFDERPTTQSEIPPALLGASLRDVAEVDPPVRSARPSIPAPPATAPNEPLPRARSSTPPAPRAAVLAPEVRFDQPSTAIFAEPSALERVSPTLIVAEEEPAGSYLVPAYVSYRPRRLRSPALWIAALATAAAGAVGYAWMLVSQGPTTAASTSAPALERAVLPRAAHGAAGPAAAAPPAVGPQPQSARPAGPIAQGVALQPQVMAPARGRLDGTVARRARQRAPAPAPLVLAPVAEPPRPEPASDRVLARPDSQAEAGGVAQPPELSAHSSEETTETPLDPLPQREKHEPAPPAAAPQVARVAPATASGDVRPPRRRASAVRIHALSVRGSLATSEVRRALERIKPQLSACYASSAAGAERGAASALQVELEIDERGRARTPRAQGSALPELEACVAAAVAKLVCGQPPDTGTVRALFRVGLQP